MLLALTRLRSIQSPVSMPARASLRANQRKRPRTKYRNWTHCCLCWHRFGGRRLLRSCLFPDGLFLGTAFDAPARRLLSSVGFPHCCTGFFHCPFRFFNGGFFLCWFPLAGFCHSSLPEIKSICATGYRATRHRQANTRRSRPHSAPSTPQVSAALRALYWPDRDRALRDQA